MRISYAYAALAISALALPPASAGKEPATGTAGPVATIELASEQMRLIMGGSAGKGVLHFRDRDYKFTFKTSSAGLGAKMVTSVSATGEVFGLQKIEDFPGRYTTSGKTLITGSSTATATYTGSNGVKIVLRGKVKGAGISLGAGQATIKLVE